MSRGSRNTVNIITSFRRHIGAMSYLSFVLRQYHLPWSDEWAAAERGKPLAPYPRNIGLPPTRERNSVSIPSKLNIEWFKHHKQMGELAKPLIASFIDLNLATLVQQITRVCRDLQNPGDSPSDERGLVDALDNLELLVSRQEAVKRSGRFTVNRIVEKCDVDRGTVTRWCVREQKKVGNPLDLERDAKGQWLIPKSAEKSFPSTWKKRPRNTTSPAKPSPAEAATLPRKSSVKHECKDCGHEFGHGPPCPKCPKCGSSRTQAQLPSRLTI